MSRPTPWEQLDGVKIVLEQILEQAVEWERSRIIKLLNEFIENSDLPEVVDRLEWLKGSIKGETK
jgi:hypothetical protein